MSRDRTATGLMLALSFSTGVLDAATYLGLDGIFIANMTGNVVFVGLGLAGGDQLLFVRAGLALGGFVLGGVVLGWVQRGRESRAGRDAVAAGTFVAAGLVVAGAAGALWWGGLPEVVVDGLTGALGLALGAQAVGARRVGVGDVSTVVVTSALAGMASEAPWTGNRADGATTLRRLSAVLTMGAGAVVGAILLRQLEIAVPMLVAAATMVVVGLATGVRAWRERRASAREPSGSPA